MNRIQLAQLRDVAIEHLPAAQEKRAMLKKHWASETTYSNSLYLTALMTLGQAGATAAEIAAAQLLEALGMWVSYDPNSPELKEFDPKDLRELAIRNIGDAVSTLGKVTGRDMAHLMPANAPAAKVEAGGITSSSGGDWKAQAREIADECFDHDTTATPTVRESLATTDTLGDITGGYCFRVMGLMQERGIKGPRGIITNPATIMREALQGKLWWANKKK